MRFSCTMSRTTAAVLNDEHFFQILGKDYSIHCCLFQPSRKQEWIDFLRSTNGSFNIGEAGFSNKNGDISFMGSGDENYYGSNYAVVRLELTPALRQQLETDVFKK